MEERPNPNDRRDFLKKSVLAGGLVWAAPAISTVASAGAQPAGTPAPGPCCSASAFGLSLSLLNGPTQVFGVNGCVPVQATASNTVTVSANVVCGSSESPPAGPCTANASVTSVTVGGSLVTTVLGGALTVDVLSSTAAASCASCSTTGSTTVVGVRIGGVQVTVGACVGLLGVLFVNEQTCSPDGTLTVNALRLTIPGVINLILAQSVADGAAGCCSSNCP